MLERDDVLARSLFEDLEVALHELRDETAIAIPRDDRDLDSRMDGPETLQERRPECDQMVLGATEADGTIKSLAGELRDRFVMC